MQMVYTNRECGKSRAWGEERDSPPCLQVHATWECGSLARAGGEEMDTDSRLKGLERVRACAVHLSKGAVPSWNGRIVCAEGALGSGLDNVSI